MTVNITGTLTIIFYYIAIVTVGVWKGRKARPREPLSSRPTAQRPRKNKDVREPDDYLVTLYVANRSVSCWLGLASMTATWVGGGYINGTADAVFNYGLIWGHIPLGYSLSLVIGGYFFAGQMRATKALTMLDPFQRRYGAWIAVLFIVPAILGELFWTASILAALGDTMSLIILVNPQITIVVSTCIILLYTTLGTIFSVLYTDVLQVITTAIGLWICVPFVVRNTSAGNVGVPREDMMGRVNTTDVSQILDQLLTTIFGGIPWQVYFQRVLSAQSVFVAKMLSYLSAVACLLLTIPPVIIGATGKTTNFTAAGYPGPFNLHEKHREHVLPFVIFYMTPTLVSIIGQLGIAAAAISSVDSSILSASSMISRNIFNVLFKPSATVSQISSVLRLTLILVGTIATVLALRVRSVFTLWMLSADLAYVLLFPQFVAFFHLNSSTNTYGAVFGFVVGFTARALCGEPELGVPVLVRLPLYDPQRGQLFPFRTLCMLLGLGILVFTSMLTSFAFRAGVLPKSLDVCRCYSGASLQGIQADGEVAQLAASAPRTPAVSTPRRSPTPATTPSHVGASRTPDAALPEVSVAGKTKGKKMEELTQSSPGSVALLVDGTIGANTPATNPSPVESGARTPASFVGTAAAAVTNLEKASHGNRLLKVSSRSLTHADLSPAHRANATPRKGKGGKRDPSRKMPCKDSRLFLGL